MDCFRRAEPGENGWDPAHAAFCDREKPRGALVDHDHAKAQPNLEIRTVMSF